MAIQSVKRFFDIIELLSEKGNLGVTEIATAVELDKATVHRMLTTAVELGYVCKEGEKYRLTLKILNLSAGVLNSISVRKLIHPMIEHLSEQCSETVHLVKLENDSIVYIDKVEALQNSVRMVSKIGMRLELYCTAVGKALLAQMDDKDIKLYWERTEVQKKTSHTIVFFDDFMEEINHVRELGFSLDNEENEQGVRCVAAACRDYSHSARYAFSVSVPVSRMNNSKIAEISQQVLESKKKIEQIIGN